MRVRLQKICRSIDERGGCPPVEKWVNGLWASLVEGEVLRQYRVGEEYACRREAEEEGVLGRMTYKKIRTGEVSYAHPSEEAEEILERARKAEGENLSEKGDDESLIREILQYLHEDYECEDYDEEVDEMEAEIAEILGNLELVKK